MKRLKTLRVRFALWTAGLLLAALTAFGGFIYFSFAQSLYTARDNTLQLNAEQTIAALDNENGTIRLSNEFATVNKDEKTRERGLTLFLYDPAGHLLQSSGPNPSLSVPAAGLAAAQQGRATFVTVRETDEQNSVRVYTAPILKNGQTIGFLQVAQNFEELEEMLQRLFSLLLVGIPGVVIVAGAGGYGLAAHALAPIDQITQTARRISAEDFSARLNFPNFDDEVGRLAATFDDMLARLEASFLRERQFTANASHEFRNPLATMQAILSVMSTQRRTPEEYEQAMFDLSETTHRLGSMVENLLRLARGDVYKTIVHKTVDLSTLLVDVMDTLSPMAEDKGLVLVNQVPPSLMLEGESDSLVRLFVNLVTNAIKYTEQGTIQLRAEQVASTLHVQIADTGRGIPVEHLPHIFERFYRVDPARTAYATEQGAGLGLAIAQEIANAHGGAIKVSSNLGKGTIFTVCLPLSQSG